MTPLLHRIMNDVCLPKAKRHLRWLDIDDHEILGLLDGVQSFDCSEVFHLSQNLCSRLITYEREVSRLTSFLPAPRTWIEYRVPETGLREAHLLISEDDHFAKCIWLIADANENILCQDQTGGLALKETASMDSLFGFDEIEYGQRMPIIEEFRSSGLPIDDPWFRGQMAKQYLTAMLYTFLGMINTPRVFQRTVHSPHIGLQRKLLAAKPLVGRFPLGAWTEILLKVPAPKAAGGGMTTDGYLTGERALHWCRAHLRYRLGQWEIVKDHWRGNPANGIKRSRYRIAASKEEQS